MRVVPLELYEHFMSSARSNENRLSRDQEESIKPVDMEIDTVNEPEPVQDTGVPEGEVNTFPEWKEFSEKSVQTVQAVNKGSKCGCICSCLLYLATCFI